MRGRSFLFIAALLGACSGRPGAQSPDMASPTSERHDDVSRHAAAALRMRDAVVRGDLEAAHREAGQVAGLQLVESSSVSAGDIDALKKAAAEVIVAANISEASRGVADVAASCGRCHGRMGGVAVTPLLVSDGDSGVGVAMSTHRWAAEELWGGLVGPDGKAWKMGALALQEAAVQPELVTPGKSPAPAVVALAQSVASSGREASAAGSVKEKSDAYAHALATCAACHAWLGGGPAASPMTATATAHVSFVQTGGSP